MEPVVLVVLVLLMVDCGDAGNSEAGNVGCTSA